MQLWMSVWNYSHHFSSLLWFIVLVPFHYSAIVTHWAQWSGSGVQGELQETRRGGGLEGTHGEETLIRGEEHSHLCALWDQDPSQEPSGLGARTQGGDWIFRRGLWVVIFAVHHFPTNNQSNGYKQFDLGYQWWPTHNEMSANSEVPQRVLALVTDDALFRSDPSY